MQEGINIITTTQEGKLIYIDESQNIVIGGECILGGKSFDRPINGKELQDALDSYALMHPRVNEDDELEYYKGNDEWVKVSNELD